MEYKLPDGQRVALHDSFTFDGYFHPRNPYRTVEEMLAFGAVEASSIDLRFYEVVDGDPVPRPIEDIRTMLKARVASDRWLKESGGFEYDGHWWDTGERARGVITGMWALALASPTFEAPTFKVPKHDQTPEYYISLSNEQIKTIGVVMAQFIQDQFTKNKEIDAQIDALQDVAGAVAFTWNFD